MEDSNEKIERLCKRRADAHVFRDQERLRAMHGETLAAIVSRSLRQPLSLDDFDRAVEPPAIDWPVDIRNAPGLVAAYIRESEASGLLECIREQVRALDGILGFHDKPYLGFASARRVDPVDLLAIAEATQDSVLFRSVAPEGVILVDCYTSQPGNPFSVVVQGDALVERLTVCFGRNEDSHAPE